MKHILYQMLCISLLVMARDLCSAQEAHTRACHAHISSVQQPLCCTPLNAYFQSLTVTGSAQFQDVQVNGNLCVTGTLCLSGSLDLGDTCITGSFCVDGPVFFGDNLSVAGSTAIGGSLVVTDTVTATNATIANLMVTMSLGGLLSDIRLKKNIKRLTPSEALKLIMRVPVVHFEWIHPELHGTCRNECAGFIAQDLEKILPELVVECPVHEKEAYLIGNDTTAKGIRINHELVAYLVASVQALHNQIKKLKKEIAFLKEGASLPEDLMEEYRLT